MTGKVHSDRMAGGADISAFTKALSDAGGDVYEVGGPVRDALIGRTVKDHDLLCRKLTIKQICSILAPFGRTATVGRSFGVVKFSPHRIPEMEIDIALPRKECSTGPGHRDFDVDFDPNLPVEEDLGRRDFTINAMAMSLSEGRLIDPFGGEADLRAGLLRMVFPKAFEEDPLRLLRGVQFSARMDLEIEPATWKAMCDSAELIRTVSPERVLIELAKLFKAEKPSAGFDLMYRSGIMKHVLPELAAIRGIEQDKRPGDDVYAHTMRVVDAARGDPHIDNKGDLELLFAALFHDTGKSRTARPDPADPTHIVFFGHQIVSARMARKWMARMKAANLGIDEANVAKLIENHMFETKPGFTDRAIRRFIAKVGGGLIFKLMDLRLADNRGGKHPTATKGVERLRKRIVEEMEKKPPFGPKDLAIDGHDIMSLGVPEGPVVGRVLMALVNTVLSDPAMNEREKLVALAKEMLENPRVLDEIEKRMKAEEAQDEILSK